MTSVKLGDRVGFGPQRDSCHSCGACAEKVENCCTSFVGLYDPRFGGYATSITVCADFAFKIPDIIPSEVAGPLLCAGITTFAPLKCVRRWGGSSGESPCSLACHCGGPLCRRHAKAGDKVGIVGIGGLGHMGLQYAA